MRDYRAVVDKIIHPRFTNIRRRMRRALEQAYQDGRDDAAAKVERAADMLARDIRAQMDGPALVAGYLA
jgi:hypothetical protein